MNSLLARLAASASRRRFSASALCRFGVAARRALGLVQPRVFDQQRGAFELGGELRILQRRGNLVGERRQQPLVVARDVAASLAHDGQQADDAALRHERNAEKPRGGSEQSLKPVHERFVERRSKATDDVPGNAERRVDAQRAIVVREHQNGLFGLEQVRRLFRRVVQNLGHRPGVGQRPAELGQLFEAALERAWGARLARRTLRGVSFHRLAHVTRAPRGPMSNSRIACS